MVRHTQHRQPTGAAEVICGAQWAAHPLTEIPVWRPGEVGFQRTGVAYVQLRCKCRVRRDGCVDRCDRQVSWVGHRLGHKYCTHCRQHPAAIFLEVVTAAAALRDAYEAATGTPVAPTDNDNNSGRCLQAAIHNHRPQCRCDCDGCLDPKLLLQEPLDSLQVTPDATHQPSAKRQRTGDHRTKTSRSKLYVQPSAVSQPQQSYPQVSGPWGKHCSCSRKPRQY